MFNELKKKLYFAKLELLLKKGIAEGKIVPFDDELYEQMSHTYVFGLPVSLRIKYLKSMVTLGQCYERSLYMFLCFENSLLVRGDTKDLEYKFGKNNAGHGWLEMNGYVYDPSLMMRFDKDLYYELFSPKNVVKTDKEMYDAVNGNFYDEVKNTTLEDFQIGGKRRLDLYLLMPLIIKNAEISAQTYGDNGFLEELNKFLESIGYDEKQIDAAMNEKIASYS